MPEKSDKPIAEIPNWLDQHDLKEVYNTSKLEILPKYEVIPEGDLTTTRKVIILSLPVDKRVQKDGKDLDITVMMISDNGVKYSLMFNSKALQRSFIGLAIKYSGAKSEKEIDFSQILNKQVGIKREQFTAQGFTQAPMKFFDLIK